MSEQDWGLSGLRTAGHQRPAAASPASEPRELAVRYARKDGRQVVTLRCVDEGAECVVQCEVYPVTGFAVEPLRPGPYRFATVDEARSFMYEAAQSLTYLGCDVS